MSSNKKIFIFLFCLFIVIVCGVLYFNFGKKASKNDPELVVNKNGNTAVVQNNVFNKSDYDVVLKKDPDSDINTNVYLKDKDTGIEKLFISIDKINKNINNSAEYYKNNLYVIRNIKISDYSYNELWKYNTKGEGKKIYSGRDMTFIIARSQGMIVVNKMISPEDNNAVVIVDLNGNTMKGFKRSEVYTYEKLDEDIKKGVDESEVFIAISGINDNYVYLQNGRLTRLYGMVRIDLSSMAVDKFDLFSLGITSQDYNFNSSADKIVFSTYPEELDTNFVAASEINTENNKVYLNYYDLNTKDKILVATSNGKKFYPKWENDNNVSYINPNQEIEDTLSVGIRIKKNIAEILK